MFSLFSTPELVNTEQIQIGNAERISISYITESIEIHETDGDTLVLKEYFNRTEPYLFADVTSNGTDIIIRNGERPLVMNLLRGHVEIYLPRQFYGVLNVKTVSGKINAPGKLVLSELTMSNTSGKITVGDVTAGTAVLSAVSGSIEVQSLKALADVHSTSGSIRVGSAAGDGVFKSVSGSVDVNYQAVTGDITASSTSGRVRLAVPSVMSFEVNASSVSGSVHIPFPGNLTGGRHSMSGTVGVTPHVKITLRTISGRIELVPAG